MPSDRSELVDFGEFRLDAAERQLMRRGEPVPLTAKAFDVLQLLVSNRDRTVTKEEFMERVWAGTIVEEANLTDNISTLRQALGDDAREPRFIRTVPRRGYRFVAEAREVPSRDTAPSPPPVRTRRVGWRTVLAALALVAVVAASLFWRRATEPSATQLRSIAVFPFERLAGDASNTHLGVSLADSLITRLTSIEALRVRPLDSVLPYAGSGRDAILAAREQEVDAFVEGRIRRLGNRIRITVQLVSVAEPRTLWASTFDEDASNLFAIEDRIADAVATELAGRVRTAPRRGAHVPSPAAYELYGAGRYFWAQRTPASLEKSIDCFERALAIDPRFALAQAGLADAWSAMGIWNFRPPRETFPRARNAALAALALDDTLAEARIALAYIRFRYDWDLAGADEEFRRGIAQKPNYASAHALYGEYLVVAGRYDEADAELRRAAELDPRSPYVDMMRAARSYFMRDYRAAIAIGEETLRDHPDFFIIREFLWAPYREAGDEARSLATRWETLRPAAVEAADIAALRAVYEREGIIAYRHAENAFLEAQVRRQYVPAVFLAMNHAQNGEAGPAMQWLERAYEERSGWMVELKVDPVWDKIRDDARFAALVRRVFDREHTR